jgi:signal peptidase I
MEDWNEENESTAQEVKVETESEKSKSLIRQIIETILYFAIILGAVLLIQRFIIQPVEVDGKSMEATLSNGNHLLLEKVSYWFGGPERFDVVVFQPYDDEEEMYYIKRIIGLPGETVQIIDNIIYINGEPLEENYGKESEIIDSGIAAEPITLGDDEYFVLGDNRNNSKDSRSESVGAIKRESILGKAWCRIWPLNKFGFIKH